MSVVCAKTDRLLFDLAVNRYSSTVFYYIVEDKKKLNTSHDKRASVHYRFLFVRYALSHWCRPNNGKPSGAIRRGLGSVGRLSH